LKVDKNSVFVVDFHQSISLTAAPRLLRQELLSFVFQSIYYGRLYPGITRAISSKKKDANRNRGKM